MVSCPTFPQFHQSISIFPWVLEWKDSKIISLSSKFIHDFFQPKKELSWGFLSIGCSSRDSDSREFEVKGQKWAAWVLCCHCLPRFFSKKLDSLTQKRWWNLEQKEEDVSSCVVVSNGTCLVFPSTKVMVPFFNQLQTESYVLTTYF